MAAEHMHFKHCLTCGKLLPDTSEYFASGVYGGGIRRTNATCKKCYAKRKAERRLVKKIEEMLKNAG
jgi:hypothetical protein